MHVKKEKEKTNKQTKTPDKYFATFYTTKTGEYVQSRPEIMVCGGQSTKMKLRTTT